jgi:diaminohydroxyphosphoribosylaminopyrimidine deaminase/5-amino-6-(5-phosphoribosylamino)uracil reductase
MAGDAERAAMRRAIEIAALGLGQTNPNPAVGAVVLDAAGEVAGEGWHRRAGGDHAEVLAMRAAGERAREGTLLVTLEPCRHTGRTGPCTEAILAAGIQRVVFAVGDPNEPAAGGGAGLRAAGVEVEAGLLADEAEALNAAWLLAHRRRRPHVTWKYASTLDGRTAAADRTSRWITGASARADVHRERSLADAVVVGIGTVLADDTHLTVRDVPASRQPLRVVVDGDARTPLSAQILDAEAETLIAVGDSAAEVRVEALQAAGAQVVRLPRRGGRIDLGGLLAALHERDVAIVLVEGGATLAASFIRDHLVDRVLGYVAPALLGAGPPVLAEAGIATIADALRLTVTDIRRVGEDIRVEAEPMRRTA